MGELILVRHGGGTEWSRQRPAHRPYRRAPDAPRRGQARSVAPLLADRKIILTLVSPARRARRTAELAGLADPETDERLWEWDYGAYEGLTTPQIQEERPGWYLWSDGVIGGETPERIGARVRGVLDGVTPSLADGDVVLVAHGHVLRVLTACRLGLPPADGRLFRLETGTISVLGTEHERPVIGSWNLPAPPD